MTTITTQATTAVLGEISHDLQETSIESERESIWKPDLIESEAKVISTVSLGSLMLGSLITLSALALLLLIFVLFNPLNYISPKFALFLVIFFGGFALEVSIAKKLSRNEK